MMEILFELTATAIQSFLIIWFVSEYCGYKYRGIKRYIFFGIMWLCDCIIVNFINQFVAYDGLISLISILEYCIYCYLCLKKDSFVHIFVVCFAMVIVFTLSSVFSMFMSAITEVPLEELFSKVSWLRLILIVICRFAEFLTFRFILYLNKAYSLSRKEWILFALLSVITWLEVVLFNKATIICSEIKIYMLGTSLLALVTNIIMYYFVLRINRESKYKTELTLLKMQYDNVKDTEEHMKALYESLHDLKHDLEKHFLAIKVKAEKAGAAAVIDYTNKIMNKYISNAHQAVFTDNEILNSIINVRLELCRHKEICVRVHIEPNALDNIEDEDIVVLFGNIFDNAIEAAEKIYGADRNIMLNVQKQGVYISIYMENGFDGEFDAELRTKKLNKNEHGIGMKNVKRIVEQYNGMIKCFPEKNMFCCDILLENRKK